MRRIRRKWLGILVALALLASLVPLAQPAQAASSYQMSYVAKVKAPYTGPIGKLIISMDGISASNAAGSEVVLSLPGSPSGYFLGVDATTQASGSGSGSIDATTGNLSATVNITTNPNYGTLTVNISGTGFTAANLGGTTPYTLSIDQVSAKLTVETDPADNNTVSKFTGTLNISATVKDSSNAVVANIFGPVDVGNTSAQNLIVTKPDGTAITGASADATVTQAPSGTLITGTNFFDTNDFIVTRLSNTTIKFKVDTVNNSGRVDQSSLISIPLNVAIPAGVSGDVNLTVSAPANSQFSSGSVVIAQVSSKKVELAVENVPTISAAGGKIGVIDLKEVVAGSLSADNKVTLTLPKGFTWASVDKIDTVWGNIGGIVTSIENEGRDLKIWANILSTEASFLKLELSVKVNETQAVAGDVKVEVSGASPSELVVARYGDYGVKVESVSTETVLAGKASQKIGKFALKEVIPASLVKDRTITLTLPDKAKWVELPAVDEDNSQLYGLVLSTFYQVDDQTVKATVNTPTSVDPAYVVIKGGKVTVAGDFSGDLELTVGGSAGASGKVKVAEVKAPVTITVSDTPQVIIGEQNQVGPKEIVLTEVKKEALGKGDLELRLPAGVTFAATPKFEVTDGNLQLGAFKLGEDFRTATVEIKSTSTKPSTIKVTGIKLSLDRTVPVGDLVVKVGGNAVVQNFIDFGVNYVAKAVAAKCVTPAPAEQKVTAVFKVGDNKYTVNGVEYPMDVAPYNKDGRVYLPVRYVAYALGVDRDNVLWNPDTQTVTLLKGATAVQLTIGSNMLKLNGVDIPMDVAPEIKDGRTMLPIRFVGQALGAKVDWDEATQTVTLNL